MKKRLRRKLGRREFAYPHPHTRREREANAQLGQALAKLIEEVGTDRFFAWVQQANESVPPPNHLTHSPALPHV
jgi:urease accessory protein UreF